MPRKARRPDAYGVPYGERQDTEQDRQALAQASAAVQAPMAPPSAPGGLPPSSGPVGTPAPGPATIEQALAAAGAAEGAPGGLLTGPSRRPNEPLTAGLPTGEGPGPEALAATQADPDLVAMAPLLPMLELLASGPTGTVQTRNLVRRLRAVVPPQAQR